MNVKSLFILLLTTVLTFSTLYTPQPILPLLAQEFFVSGSAYSMRWNTDLKFTNASFKMTAYYPKDGDHIILEQLLNDVSITS